MKNSFPHDFIFGASTSAYQIEGAWNADGKGPSIWDIFTHLPGTIQDETSGDVAADHYHRYRRDIEILDELGCNAYRFSISWPRIFPEESGRLNSPGLDFYKRLVDGLLEKNIDPFITLYHWDHPFWVEQKGGWPNRETIGRFCDYVDAVLKALGDRVRYWITLNEPISVVAAGYAAGIHAPGKRSIFKAVHAVHTFLLAHGEAVSIIRGRCKNAKIGISNSFSPVYPYRRRDRRLAARVSAFINKLFMDPLLKKRYPSEIWWLFRMLNWSIKKSDFDVISRPIDFIGVNHYSRYLAKRTLLPLLGYAFMTPVYENVLFTDIDWEIYPYGISEILQWIKDEYGNPPVFITENGAAFNDTVKNGRVLDNNRVDYLKRYLAQVDASKQNGCDVRGYFVWSLLDNFEWQYGFSKRFGLVHVDYETLERTIKESGFWYKEFIATKLRNTN